MSSVPPRPAAAFTLVELLVVIGIVGLLVAILLPALSAVRREGNRAKCLSNMRNMAMAQYLYVNDNHGWLVQGGMAHGGAHANEDITWFNTLNRYYNNKLVARCPADTSAFWETPVFVNAGVPQFRRTSYGINGFLDRDLCPWGPGFSELPEGRRGIYIKIEHVRHASEVVQFVEMMYGDAYSGSNTYAGADHVHPNLFALATTPDRAIPALVAQQIQINSHGPKRTAPAWDAVSNYSYIDGHAASERLRDVYGSLYVNRFDPGSPQPMP